MYGFYPRGSAVSGIPSARREYTNGAAAIAANDIVALEGGLLTALTAADWITGVSEEAQAISATGCGVNITPWLSGLMDNDNVGTTFAATHVGDRFDTTGGTGAQQVDTSSADNSAGAPVGNLGCMEYNPQVSPYETDTSIGLFMIIESLLYAGSSA